MPGQINELKYCGILPTPQARIESLSDQEFRFEAQASKRRQRTIGAVVLSILIGYLLDIGAGIPFPSGTTLSVSVAVFMAFQLFFSFRGARSLVISAGGVTLERSTGGKVLRLSWTDIKKAEVRRSPLGQVWKFHTKQGEIRWAQTDFDGDQRLELEKVLRNALNAHGIRCD